MRKFILPVSLVSASFITGCPGTDVVSKGAFDETALESGVTSDCVSDVCGVTIALSAPIDADVADETLQQFINASTSVLIESDETGTSANLTEGTAVDGTPAGAGEYSWSLNDARDSVTLSFFNLTSNGLTLKADRIYTGTVSVSTNPYVENIDAVSFPVTVTVQ